MTTKYAISNYFSYIFMSGDYLKTPNSVFHDAHWGPDPNYGAWDCVNCEKFKLL